ncbi:FAD-dependent monooxygenase [Noviherbaspirillum galbum]|uniref:2-octaprenyl-6-methoxyphenyl hydroxylase n=1 Tax=Noviherbaspirillum galbum TaxID=2709383 RepID=A0A6B3SRK1_9BURK|nr:FAD-dependent monooxygenase [Noviherbaspirillum galbum]NEX61406.1 2-octaprenyl-6-methoxyphenyl hydroxylase [Noviherbaspirillum galbum]
MTVDIDIAICGAGPVGQALALLLVRRGVDGARILLIDAKPLDKAAADPRSIALSHGSRQVLEDIRAWPIACAAIHDIHVSRRGHFGRTVIDRNDYGVPALGYVARYGELVGRLDAELRATSVVSLRPATVTGITERDDAVELRFADGGSKLARILVQAEGGVYAEQEARPLARDYRQTALIAHVTASQPVPHRAFERFTEEGPLALLPEGDGYAMVWCARPDTALRLQSLSDTEFLAALGDTFGTRLGRFLSASPRAAFPLGLNARHAVGARTVAIGNAAQTLHPVAGQGLNLGLRDAVVLARLLAQDLSSGALERFAAQRQRDRGMTIRVTDAMARVFASAPDGAVSQALLGAGLGLIDVVRPAKRVLAEQMMFGVR